MKISRGHLVNCFIFASIFFLMLIGIISSVRFAEAQPNIVHILTDDQRADSSNTAESFDETMHPVREVLEDTAEEVLEDTETDDSIMSLMEALNNEDEDIRESVLEELVRMGTPEAVYALTGSLNFVKGETLYEVIEVLGEIGTPEAIDALNYALYDYDRNVR